MTLREALFAAIDDLNAAINELNKRAPKPLFDPAVHAYRHLHKDAHLAAFLKCARSVSILNACRVLLEVGHVVELYALCRPIDEANEDVTFLLMVLPPEDEQQRERYLREFYQEEFDVPGDPMASTQKRDRVSRQRIQNAITRTTAPVGLPLEKLRKAAASIHKTFSGFIHGAYVHIMEHYNDSPPRLFLKGYRGTPKIDECEDSFASNVYRTVLAVRLVSRALEYQDLNARLRETQIRVAAASGCDDYREVK